MFTDEIHKKLEAIMTYRNVLSIFLDTFSDLYLRSNRSKYIVFSVYVFYILLLLLHVSMM